MKSICSAVSEARAAAPGEYIPKCFCLGLSSATQTKCEDVDDYACSFARTPTGEGRRRSVEYFRALHQALLWALTRKLENSASAAAMGPAP